MRGYLETCVRWGIFNSFGGILKEGSWGSYHALGPRLASAFYLRHKDQTI